MFHLKDQQTTAKTEVLAGMTTFLTMAYIIIVNPIILADAGVPFDQVFLATIIAAAVGTLWMALFANYPIAIAPGMGLNAYFTSVVLASDGKLDYMTAFSAVFIAGILFVILSLTPFREKLIKSIPENLKHGITAGIGLFIAFIGLKLSEIVTSHETNLVQLGDLTSPTSIVGIVWANGHCRSYDIKCLRFNLYRYDFDRNFSSLYGSTKVQRQLVASTIITRRHSCLESSYLH